MAKETIVTLTDDLVGGEAEETVQFGLRGTQYEIDLNAKNVAAIEKALAKYIGAAQRIPAARVRRARPGRRPAPAAGGVGTIRSWAKENGFTVSDRGRIPTEVRDAYQAAHG